MHHLLGIDALVGNIGQYSKGLSMGDEGIKKSNTKYQSDVIVDLIKDLASNTFH